MIGVMENKTIIRITGSFASESINYAVNVEERGTERYIVTLMARHWQRV